MGRTAIAVAIVMTISAGYLYSAKTSAQGDNIIQPGCGIPKSYGKLVSVLPARPGGPGAGTTYAVFEAEDGIIRWVAATPTGTVTNTQRSSRTQIVPAFIESYECSLGAEWKRQ